jgi:hypothetical protein
MVGMHSFFLGVVRVRVVTSFVSTYMYMTSMLFGSSHYRKDMFRYGREC